MKRIGLIGLALIAMCVLSSIAASSSLAVECRRVRIPGSGVYENSLCEVAAAPKEWVKVLAHTKYLGQGLWCVETEINKGNRSDSQCRNEVTGKYIEVIQPGPNWRVGGSHLEQGAKQIKLQTKGATVLTGKVLVVTVEIECKNSVSEGATIEGRGNFQGQDKGRFTFTQCKTITPTSEACRIVEPITTSQMKSYLAFNANSRQQKLVDVFEPQQGRTFAVLRFRGLCEGVFEEARVEGSVAAEPVPIEKETQEGLLNFPKAPITTIIYEAQERKIGLTFLGEPAIFAAVFGARLSTNEPWGVFSF